MVITMLETHQGSEDRFVVRTYQKGVRYKVCKSMAISFINRGWGYNSDPFDEEIVASTVEA